MSRRNWVQGSHLVVRRLGDGARSLEAWPWARMRHWALWLGTWSALAGGLARVWDEGAAAVCWRPPYRRQKIRYLGVVVGLVVVVIAVLVVVPGMVIGDNGLAFVLYFGALGLCVLALFVGLAKALVAQVCLRRRLRAQDRRLEAARPRHGWCLYNFVGNPERRGEARLLLAEVCAEADRRRRVLYLDTVVPRLVTYYSELGFRPVADVDVELAGEAMVIYRMVRERPGPDDATAKHS
ncbi:MAG: hypothetical protein M3011_12710 [Actinomycetota bacterium]|nr:hypothetical protein [Actinomycetota bacterium]